MSDHTENPPEGNGTPSAENWHQPRGKNIYFSKKSWFVPWNAPSDEELATLAEQREAAAVQRPHQLPEAVPETTGGWYRPPDAITVDIPDNPTDSFEQPLSIRQADSVLADLDFQPVEGYKLDRDISDAVDMGDLLGDMDIDDDEDEEFLEPDASQIEDSGFQEAPEGISGSNEFQEAPPVPLSAQLQPNLGGLRDREETKDIPGPQTDAQASVSEETQDTGIPVPQRGFGGVVDQETPDLKFNPSENKQETPMTDSADRQSQQQPAPTPDSETGELQGTNPNVTMTMNNTPADSDRSQDTPPPTATGPAAPRQEQPAPVVDKFAQIEQQVDILRQQFRQGYITRSQLEAQLKKLMIPDEYGRWWTLGVDSNTWYRYSGEGWVADSPPRPRQPAQAAGSQQQQGQPRPGPQQPGQQQAASGSAARTETNPQQAVPSGQPAARQNQQQVSIDEYGMPLPQQVPEQDHDATLVNIRAATATSQDDSPETVVGISSPAPDAEAKTVASERPYDIDGDAYEGMDPNDAAAVTMQNRVAPDEAGEAEIESPAVERPSPKRKLSEKERIQPDYSAAFRGADGKQLQRYVLYGGLLSVVAGLMITLCVIVGTLVYYFSTINAYQDDIETMDQGGLQFETTRLYDAGGNQIASFNADTGQRTYVPLEEISPYMIHATIATEDESFYDNPGFSLPGIVRAIYTNVTSTGPRSGASTITQQLVKQVILGERLNEFDTQTERKLEEIMIATEVARQYTKNEILELYLNQIYYGNQSYGVEAAAQTYFNKSARDLNPYEAAFLAGIPQAPARWDPVANLNGTLPPEQCGPDSPYAESPECLGVLGRMRGVIRLMAEANGDGCIQMEHQFNHTISYELYDPVSGNLLNVRELPPIDLSQPFCISQEMLESEFPIEQLNVELKAYTPASLDIQHPHFSIWVRNQLNELFTEEQVAQGLNVYTTLNPSIQQEAERAVQERVAQVTANNGMVVVLNPQNGEVLAMVGSVNFDDEEIDGQVNIATSPQQPGSTIKPLVYLVSLEGDEEGYWTPGTVIWDVPTNFNGYEPTNFSANSFQGPVTMRNALAQSLNIPAVRTLAHTGIPPFEQKAAALGLTFPLQEPQAAGLPSALGAVEIYPLELAAAYSAIANGGYKVNPFGIMRVESTDGEILYEANLQPQRVSVITPQHAYLMNHMLSDNNARTFGQGTLNIPGRTIAVKTGTSQDARDVWTIGWTPGVMVATWFGNTDNSIFDRNTTGSVVAAPVWNRVIQTALSVRDPNNTETFENYRPEGITQYYICNDTGARVENQAECGIGGGYFEVFWNAQPPPTQEEVDLFQTVQVERFSNLRVDSVYCPNTTGDLYEQRSFLQTNDESILNWIRNYSQGQQWAAARDIDVDNLSAPPEGECGPDYIQPIVQIGSPPPSQVLSGLVSINGTVRLPNFDHYEVQIAPAETGIFRTIFSNPNMPPPNSELATWGTTFDPITGAPYPNGAYVLRIISFARNGETLQSDIPVSVQNVGAIPGNDGGTDSGTDTGTDNGVDQGDGGFNNQPGQTGPTPTAPPSQPTPTLEGPAPQATQSN